jgi:hypothetical protein
VCAREGGGAPPRDLKRFVQCWHPAVFNRHFSSSANFRFYCQVKLVKKCRGMS